MNKYRNSAKLGHSSNSNNQSFDHDANRRKLSATMGIHDHGLAAELRYMQNSVPISPMKDQEVIFEHRNDHPDDFPIFYYNLNPRKSLGTPKQPPHIKLLYEIATKLVME